MSTDGWTEGRTDEPITIVPFDLRRGTTNGTQPIIDLRKVHDIARPKITKCFVTIVTTY